jgi:hypothetical protein
MAVNMVGDMQVNVIAPNGSWINVFDLETTFKLKFEVHPLCLGRSHFLMVVC